MIVSIPGIDQFRLLAFKTVLLRERLSLLKLEEMHGPSDLNIFWWVIAETWFIAYCESKKRCPLVTKRYIGPILSRQGQFSSEP